MKLVKNGSQNQFEKTDFKDLRAGKDYRSANAHNTACKSGPLKPTPAKAR